MLKKHLLSIITTAILVVNLILSIVIVFSVLPTTSKMNKMITQICTALSLELESQRGEEVELKIEDMEEIAVEGELTIPLKKGEDDKDHYAIAQIAVVVNNKHEDYSKYVESITTKESLIKDAINSEIGSFTIDELKNNPEAVQEATLERLQELFDSDFIVKIAFKELVFQ